CDAPRVPGLSRAIPPYGGSLERLRDRHLTVLTAALDEQRRCPRPSPSPASTTIGRSLPAAPSIFSCDWASASRDGASSTSAAPPIAAPPSRGSTGSVPVPTDSASPPAGGAPTAPATAEGVPPA